MKQWLKHFIRRFALWLLWVIGEDLSYPTPIVPLFETPRIVVPGVPTCNCGQVVSDGSLKQHDGVYRCVECKGKA